LKIDFHVHSTERSDCAVASETEQIQAAIRGGLDAIAFSDHDCLVDRRHLSELNRQYAPFRIFTAIEVTLASEHVLVIGIADPDLESCGWEYKDLQRFVRRRDGFIALAHPFRYQEISVDIKQFPPDAIEVFSPNTPLWAEKKIRQIAASVGCSLLSNSDSHTSLKIGKYYNVVEGEPQNDAELLQSLKKRTWKYCYEPSSSLPRI
jgi:predicted metal-dependent phosphoesterase TrpH